MAFVYILFSSTLDRYYIGATEATPEERLIKHLSNHKGFTAKAKDWVIVYTEMFETKDLALKREKQIKAWKSKTAIEQLIAR
ncbi:MAG: GIY-YIG nuclease family protein [Saprospiraceae bacterium]